MAILSAEVDCDTQGESENRVKMILRPEETFYANVPIHHC